MRWLLVLSVLVLGLALALVFGLEGSHAAPSVVLNPNHECAFCHGLHGARSGQLLQDTTVEAVCLSCHGPGGTATLVEVHTNDPTGNSCCAPFRITCRRCHDPHSNQINRRGNENLKLVRAEIDPPDSILQKTGPRQVVFESRSGDFSFCDQQGPENQPAGQWDNVCDVCHASADVGRHHYDGTETVINHHQSTNTCTQCHTHDNALNP